MTTDNKFKVGDYIVFPDQAHPTNSPRTGQILSIPVSGVVNYDSFYGINWFDERERGFMYTNKFAADSSVANNGYVITETELAMYLLAQ